jgi:hypothetical protein
MTTRIALFSSFIVIIIMMNDNMHRAEQKDKTCQSACMQRGMKKFYRKNVYCTCDNKIILKLETRHVWKDQ